MRRYVENVFDYNTSATFGADNSMKVVEIGLEKILLSIWDTAGQERFQSIVPSYFRGSQAAIFVYDITNEASFLRVSYWLGKARELAGREICMVLIGNKADLEVKRKVLQKTAMELAKSNNMLFFEASCLTSENVDLAFMEIVNRLYGQDGKVAVRNESLILNTKGVSIQALNSTPQNIHQKSKCCGKR